MFAKKTTATVLASFNRTLNDLNEVEAAHAAEAEQHSITIAQAHAAREAATAEATAARNVAKRIQALLETSVESADEGIGVAAPLRAVG